MAENEKYPFYFNLKKQNNFLANQIYQVEVHTGSLDAVPCSRLLLFWRWVTWIVQLSALQTLNRQW